ncbi:MAG: GNAT family N-acetyltransferase [Actinomycetota bacterium]|nr:GNAT family N-acetyltransferase [Actinomycetota bacterium]
MGAPRSEGATDGLSFRPLRPSDLPLMHRWLNAPHVARWWYGEDASWRGIQEKYFPRIEDREPVEPHVILHGDDPIGYIQAYPISHDEEYARLVGVEDSAGVDLFIGEEEYLYRGLGSEILRRFLAEVVFRDEGVQACVIGPEPENVAAIRAYEKAGFRFFKTIQVPAEPEPEYLMKITREGFETASITNRKGQGCRQRPRG